MRRSLALAAGWTLAALVGLIAGSHPAREPFSPPPIYATWWDRVSRCVAEQWGQWGHAGARNGPALMPQIRWYRARADGFPCAGTICVGAWEPPNVITLARGYEQDPTIVSHEMIHHLLPGVRHGDSLLEAVMARCIIRSER